MPRRKLSESELLAAIGSTPQTAVSPRTAGEIMQTPAYSALAHEIYLRRGSQTRFYHVAAWPQTHWWDLQAWINQAQYELEQLFGPIVKMQSTDKQNHGGKVYFLVFFEIGPIHPEHPPLKVGSAWRTFITGDGEK